MMRLGTAGEAVYREHPIKILRYSAKNLWLLIFPLLRSLRFYPFSLQKLIDWGAGAWFDLLVALLILGIGTLRWHACTYYFDEVSIRSQSGILLRRGTEIPLERIASTVEEHPFYLRPLRAACLQISTAAGAVPEADMHLTLYLRDLHRLRQHYPCCKMAAPVRWRITRRRGECCCSRRCSPAAFPVRYTLPPSAFRADASLPIW